MSITRLDFAAPFFPIKLLEGEDNYAVSGKTILVNLDKKPIKIEDQSLDFLKSIIVTNVVIQNITKAVLIEKFSDYEDESALFEQVKSVWPLAFDVRKEERLRGVSHYMSPKAKVGKVNLSMYHSGSVPLNVGLHKFHPHCELPGFKEVHTQIVGFGKMQQCREADLSTLYLEELMAPGTTHSPMFDEDGNYPWHQYETLTPSIFMAIEISP